MLKIIKSVKSTHTYRLIVYLSTIVENAVKSEIIMKIM